MGSLNTALNAASITMGMYQSREESESRQIANNLAASTLEAQAARKELEAGEALKIGELNQAEQAVKGRAGIAERKTAYAYGGVKVNEGSALEVAADKAAWSEYERRKIEYGAEMESWGLQYDAALLRSEAANTRAGGGSGYSATRNAIGPAKQWIGLFSK
ncbi:MAG: hypothetical protein LBS30_01805 [Planctomycetota bacterium]|jgi:hypothetical protein|nr:hypothetical protein [Planctomycetota bacterium]